MHPCHDPDFILTLCSVFIGIYARCCRLLASTGCILRLSYMANSVSDCMTSVPRRLRVAHTCALRKPVFQQTGAMAPKEAGNSPEEYARIHGEFMTMVHDLIDGSLESSAYEDHCRALLGE